MIKTLLIQQHELNFTGKPLKIDDFGSIYSNDFTASAKIMNFVGRIYIQGSLAPNPIEEDWFDIPLGADTSYLEYDTNTENTVNDFIDTARYSAGESLNQLIRFTGDFSYLRGKIDRSYLPDKEYIIGKHGSIISILVAW